jgi:hypothetical protein
MFTVEWLRLGPLCGNFAEPSASSWAYSPSMTYLAGNTISVGWNGQPPAPISYMSAGGTGPLVPARWRPPEHEYEHRLGGHPSLATDGTNLYVAWEEQAATGGNSIAYVKKWDGVAWSQVGGALNADPILGSRQAFHSLWCRARPQRFGPNSRTVICGRFTPSSGTGPVGSGAARRPFPNSTKRRPKSLRMASRSVAGFF